MVVLVRHFGLSLWPNRHTWLPGSHWHYCPKLSQRWIVRKMRLSTAFCGSKLLLDSSKPTHALTAQCIRNKLTTLFSADWILNWTPRVVTRRCSKHDWVYLSAVTQERRAGEFLSANWYTRCRWDYYRVAGFFDSFSRNSKITRNGKTFRTVWKIPWKFVYIF